MFAKFAKAEILDVKSAPSRVREASLDHFADFDGYRTDDDYIYVRTRAISSRVNKNHDGWPASELKKSYKSFIGKPLFVDHHNSDPARARGVVVDAQLHIDEDTAKVAAADPYYASAPEEHLPATWVELLLEVDAKTYPKLAKAIVDGDIDGVSMGANVEWTKCSHCANVAHTPEEYCSHVRSKGAYFDKVAEDGTKTSKRAYEDCYDFGFFELSFVFDPADETALVSDIKHAHRMHVAKQVEAEGAQSFQHQMVSRARIAYRQALSEGADEPTAWRAAMSELRDHGIMGKEALGYVKDAVQPHAQTVSKTGAVGDLPFEEDPNAMPMEEGDEGLATQQPEGMSEDAATRDWVLQQLMAAGLDEHAAANIANMPHEAYGNIMRILEKGASPEQAYSIVANFQKEAPGKEHMKGVSPKRNRQYEHIKEQCLADGGSEEHCKEMAARTVNKQRAEHGETKSYVNKEGFVVEADRHNPRPQSEATVAPEDVDTLRQEQICPICGSDMEDGVCVVCNYEEPPEGFDMPDLEEAQRVDDQMRQQDEQQAAQGQQGAPSDVQLAPNPGGGVGSQPGTPGMLASFQTTGNTSSSTTVRVDMSANSHTAAGQDDGRVNTVEKPVLPATQQTSDRPAQQRTEADEREAVESSTKEPNMSDEITKVADGAEPAGGADVKPDARVDVESKGGVATGDPLAEIPHQDVEKETQEHAPHTDTWSGMEGQTDAVQGEAFPKAGSEKTAEMIGGDPLATATTVDVEAPIAEETGEETKTWSDNTVNGREQADPVTNVVDPNIDTGEGHEHQPSGVPSTTAAVAAAKRVAIKAMKLADLEQSLSLLDAADKFDRATELAETSEESIDAQLETLSKVKTAGLRKAEPEKKVAGRLPSFKPVHAAFDPSEHGVDDQEVEDSKLFL